MTLREAFNNIKFRKGTWRIWFDGDDETEFYAESLDDLESLWNEFSAENDLPNDTVDDVFEIFDPSHGDWFDGSDGDKEYVIDQLEWILRYKREYELDVFAIIGLRAAIEYISRAKFDESFWVDGIEIKQED